MYAYIYTYIHIYIYIRIYMNNAGGKQQHASELDSLLDLTSRSFYFRLLLVRRGTRICRGVLQCVAVCCSVLQCGAVWCILVQYAAVCCSVLQCAAVCICRDSLMCHWVRKYLRTMVYSFELCHTSLSNVMSHFIDSII